MKKCSWIVHSALCCDKGKIRKNNEDAFFFNGRFMPADEMDKGDTLAIDVPAKESLWAVCDGMGGEENGEVASYTVVSEMSKLQDRLHNRDFATALQAWIREINTHVFEKASGGGSTLAMLYCEEESLQIAHIGDSRVYRLRRGKLEQMTRDHSKVELMISAGMITPEEARMHPQKNVITRYLGMNDEYICEATISPRIQIAYGDRYLLCSDGVTDMLTNDAILELLSNTQDASRCIESIRNAVFEAGARDNLTILVLDFTSEDESAAGGEDFEDSQDDAEEYEDEEPTVDEGLKKRIVVNVDMNSRESISTVFHINYPKQRLNVNLRIRSSYV